MITTWAPSPLNILTRLRLSSREWCARPASPHEPHATRSCCHLPATREPIPLPAGVCGGERHWLGLDISRSKHHHFVPQSYLKLWANQRDQVAFRKRGESKAGITSTQNIAVETDLYTVGTPAGPSDRVEKLLADLEAQLPGALQDIRRGVIPRENSAKRTALGLLLAIQDVRTPHESIRRSSRRLSPSMQMGIPFPTT